MVRGRTATADGGEDPLLTSTLIINMRKSRNEGRHGDAEPTTLYTQFPIWNMISTTQAQEEAFLIQDMNRGCIFLFNYVSLYLVKSYRLSSFPPSNLTHVSFTHFPLPPTLYLLLLWLLLFCIPLSTSPVFLYLRQWCLVNIRPIHPSFKCRHYGYQMHLWLFRPIDWHNQYVIFGKFWRHYIRAPRRS